MEYVRGMWEYFRRDRDGVNTFREQAEEEKQAGIQGQWQLESPAKEYLEQVKRRDDTYCTEDTALKSGDWEEYKRIFRVEVKVTEMGL